jgi:SAM-dependent methyltransferase
MNIGDRIGQTQWYHTIDLGKFGVTAGVYDHREYLPFYGLPSELEGWRVLDVGAGHGFFSFHFEEMGADVTAINPRDWREEDCVPSRTAEWAVENATPNDDGLLLAKRVLKSNVSYRRMSIYDITPARLGLFEMTFCGSLLCHLMNPLMALGRIRAVTTKVAIVATIVLDEPNTERRPFCLFTGLHNRSANTFWIPNHIAFQEMLIAAGFSKVNHVASFTLRSRKIPGEGGHHAVMHAYV